MSSNIQTEESEDDEESVNTQDKVQQRKDFDNLVIKLSDNDIQSDE